MDSQQVGAGDSAQSHHSPLLPGAGGMSLSQDIQEMIIQLNQELAQLFQQDKYEEATGIALRICELARENLGEDSPLFAHSLNNLAVVYRAQGKYTQAEPLLRQAVGIWHLTQENSYPFLAIGLENLAEICRERGEYAQAEACYQQALAIRRTVLGATHPDIAKTLGNLAALYDTMGNYAQAEMLYQQALDIRRKTLGEAHPSVATCIGNLAALYYAIGNYAQAELFYQQALAIQRVALGEGHPDIAANLNNLAVLYKSTGNYIRAELFYRQALALWRAALGEGHPNVAACLNNVGMLYYEMGDYTQAESLYQQALASQRAISGEMHPAVASYLNNLAALSRAVGNYPQSEQLYQQALTIRRKILGVRHPSFAVSLDNLAELYRTMGDYAQAEPLYRQALEIRRAALGEIHPEVAASMNNLGAMYCAIGNYTEAEALYKQAQEITGTTLGEVHPSFVVSLNNLARVYAATSRETEAMTMMKRAASTDDKMIGQVFSLGSERQRMSYLTTLRGNFDAFLSLVFQRFPHSRAEVRTALDLVLRRKAIGAEALAAQRDAILGGRYPDLAPKLHELAILRAQIAQKALAGAGSEGLEVHQQLLAAWSAQQERLEADLAHQIPEMNLAQKLQAADWQAIAKALPPMAALVEFVRFDVFDFHAVPARRERRWKAAHYAAFVLVADEPASVHMIDLGEADPIDQLITTFRTAITGETEANTHERKGLSRTARSQGEKSLGTRYMKPGLVQRSTEKYRGAGIALRRAILDPLVAALGDRERLFLAPDGDLNRLPFEVLPADDGRHLIDTYQISYLSTGRDVLRFRATSGGRVASSLIVADPDFDLSATNEPTIAEATQARGRRSRDLKRGSLHFDRLSGIRKEGEHIARMLGVQPFLEGKALEGRLKACHSPYILHIATHGFFLPDQRHDPNTDAVNADSLIPTKSASGGRLDRFLEQHVENPLLRSGLALAGANTWNRGGVLPPEAEDGLLTAEDVSGLDLLSTELVVLSACETGLGKVHVGEGVFGLRRAFVLAGARTLVMSLWKVPDQQTRELMEHFYHGILAGQPRADALRKAQLAMKATYQDPYYWGAFICQGDPNPVPHGT
jgi:tetratricopeptide (TPR) repeat protein/CHAT domain-containing protein